MVALAALEQYAQTSLADLDEWHVEMFRAYRDELEEYFRRYSQPGRRPPEDRDPKKLPPDVWAMAAVQDRVPGELAASFAELSEALYIEDVEAIGDWLDDAMVEGHQRELWLLAMSGMDIDPYLDSLPAEEDDRSELLLVLGVLGVGWLARRAFWRDDVTQRMTQWVNASVVGGLTLEETLAGFDRVSGSFTDRVQELVRNELVRAHDIGMDLALTAAQKDHEIAEVWVTRADRLVCLVCAPRHMRVTPLQPITDSHPGCRCRKVPVPKDFEYTDVAYDELFETAFGGE